MRFTGVALITRDVPALVRFYEAVLQVTAEGDDVHAELRVEGAGLAIYSQAAAEGDMGFDFRVHNGTGKLSLIFQVEDVDAEYARLQGLGVEFVTTPTTHPWGARSMHFRDPDGNIVAFAVRA